MNTRAMLEQFLVDRAGMTPVAAAALNDEQVCEHFLALHNIACISVETAEEIERIEAANYNVSLQRLDAAIFAIYAGALGEYRRPLEVA
jgi:hypothetical protein